MVNAHVVLAAVLTVANGPSSEPDRGWDDVDAEAETAPSPPPPEAAAPQPEVRYEARPVPIPPRKGTGLLISAGILGALGWGMMGYRIGIMKSSCRPPELDDNPDLTVDDFTGTVDATLGCASAEVLAFLGWSLQATAGAVNYGLAPAGGARRGKYEAAMFVEHGRPARKHKVWIGVGAGLLAAGLIGRLTVAAVRWDGMLNYERSTLGRCIPNGNARVDDVFNCYATRRQLHFFGQQFTSSMISAGGGMLAFGLANRKWKKRYHREYKEDRPEKVKLGLSPQVGLTYTGIQAELKF